MSFANFSSTSKVREMNPTEVDAESTHATGWINDQNPTMQLMNTFHSGGGPHAEDKLAEYIEVNNIRDTTLCVYLTKSPCTSTKRGVLPATGKGCAEMLCKLAKERNLRFQFLVRNYYQPSIKGADQASVEAVKWLSETGMFAFSIDKMPRSKTGKALQAAFEENLKKTGDDNGFVVADPMNNDIGREEWDQF